MVGCGAPVPASVRGRRQPARLLLSRHGEVLLPREQGVGGGAAGARGGGRARGRAVRARRGAVQRQRRRQGGQGPARGRGAVRARRVAGPRPGAPRARPLPPGRVRRAPRRRGRPPPLAPRRGAASRPRRGGRRRRGGQPVHGGVVGADERREARDSCGRRRQLRRRRGGRGGAAPVLARAVRAAGDAAARVPAVLGVRVRQLLLARVPGAGLEARAPRPVRRRPLARRRERVLNARWPLDDDTCGAHVHIYLLCIPARA